MKKMIMLAMAAVCALGALATEFLIYYEKI